MNTVDIKNTSRITTNILVSCESFVVEVDTDPEQAALIESTLRGLVPLHENYVVDVTYPGLGGFYHDHWDAERGVGGTCFVRDAEDTEDFPTTDGLSLVDVEHEENEEHACLIE